MRFERGKDPRHSMGIGAAEAAIPILDIQWMNHNSVTGHSEGMTTMSKKKVHGLFRLLSKQKSISLTYYKEMKRCFRPRLSASGDLIQNKMCLSWDRLIGHFVMYEGTIYDLPKNIKK